LQPRHPQSYAGCVPTSREHAALYINPSVIQSAMAVQNFGYPDAPDQNGKFAAVLAAYTPPFLQALQAGHTERANAIAMMATDQLMTEDPDAGRPLLWKNFFSKLRHSPRYQAYDFEIVDYSLYSAVPGPILFRGPRPELSAMADGNYLAFLGAAQFFGRFQREAPHSVVADLAKIACINLSMAGAGPESFLKAPILSIAAAGKAAVLQVLSGRSVGCDEYPGLRFTVRKGDGSRAERLTILKEIWKESRQEAKRLVGKWQLRYVTLMRQLIEEVRVPVLLVWASERSPDEWSIDRLDEGADFGAFPHLVERWMVDEIAARASRCIEVSGDPGLPYPFRSRFHGGSCPRLSANGKLKWENSYYPSAILSRRISEAVAQSLTGLL
jgi:hypothetical protein